MPSLLPLEETLAAAWPPHAWEDVTVLVAVSGGADSVALLRAMATLKTRGPGRLHAAHLNHQLRGPDAEADERFVVELCRSLDIPCEVYRVHPEELEAASGDGLEAAARAVRYDFLRQTAERLGARYVVTAHTADDQAETILHRIVRGTGVAGLAGMRRARTLSPACTLIRPLLGVRRAELLDYLDAIHQPYRSDLSNADRRFTRNRIRHELLPLLAASFNPGVVEAVLRLGQMAREVQDLVTQLVDDLAQQCVTRPSENECHIDTRRLANQPRYLIRELLIAVWREAGWPLQAMGFAEWDLLAEMASQASESPRKRVFPGNVTVERLEETVCLRGPAVMASGR
jgi:tRNA(Ile)-lysidine synthase